MKLPDPGQGSHLPNYLHEANGGTRVRRRRKAECPHEAAPNPHSSITLEKKSKPTNHLNIHSQILALS